MKNNLKSTITSIIAGAIAVASVSAFSLLSESGSEKSKNTVTSEKSVQSVQTKNTNAVQMYHFTRYQKAPISDYDKSSNPQTVKYSEKKNSDDEFTVKFPDSGETYPDEKPEPLYLTDTRSIAEEFYTVYDENSGKTLTLNGHELICQIVNNEVGGGWDENSIKAQAVAAYSYIRYGDDNGYIRQVGLREDYTPFLESCVTAVEGQAVYSGSAVANGVYSASTAGYSTASAKVWGGNLPYLQAVKSEYDNQDPHWQDKTVFSKSEVKNKLEKALDIKMSSDEKKWFNVKSCYSVRYIGEIEIDGQKTISGVKLCNILDITSNAMDISYKDGKFTFTSYGWGHGVGMSQWGARLYAQHGWTYDQILRHYYTGTTIRVSDVNMKAVERGRMSDEERREEAEQAAVDSNTDAIPVNAPADETTDDSQQEKTPDDSSLSAEETNDSSCTQQDNSSADATEIQSEDSSSETETQTESEENSGSDTEDTVTENKNINNNQEE